MKEMHWYVIDEDFNERKIGTYDIFRHGDFAEDVQKAYKKHKKDYGAFAEEVRKSLFYYFNSKTEWEVIVSAWPPWDKVPDKKIDVYDQVMLNWDVFIGYVWACCHERKARSKCQRKLKQYALYNGDDMIMIGDVHQIADWLGVSEKYVYWLSTPAGHDPKRGLQMLVYKLD